MKRRPGCRWLMTYSGQRSRVNDIPSEDSSRLIRKWRFGSFIMPPMQMWKYITYFFLFAQEAIKQNIDQGDPQICGVGGAWNIQ